MEGEERESAALTADMGVKFQIANGGNARTSDLVLVPEPTGMGLLGLGAAGLLSRRRRNKLAVNAQA